jgi:hypothetical protein
MEVKAMSSVSDHADALEQEFRDEYSYNRVKLGRDIEPYRDFVVVGRVSGDDPAADDGDRLIVSVAEIEPAKFRYHLHYRRAYGKHCSDKLIRDCKRDEMRIAVRDFLMSNAA